MNTALKVQTAEISEADLDHVAGGLAVHVGAGLAAGAGVCSDGVAGAHVEAQVCVEVAL